MRGVDRWADIPGGGGNKGTTRCHHQNDSAVRWAALTAILWERQSHKTLSMNRNI